jgi:hypothetical protein
LKGCGIQRSRLAHPVAADIKKEQQVPIAKFAAGEGGRDQVRLVYSDPQFLFEFSRERRLQALPWFDLSARKLPQALHLPPLGALLEQNPPVSVDQSPRDYGES